MNLYSLILFNAKHSAVVSAIEEDDAFGHFDTLCQSVTDGQSELL